MAFYKHWHKEYVHLFSMMDLKRNFCVIAHIDHGKSTLADRLLEETGTLKRRQMGAQILDNMDLEQERGITIKSHAIQMTYKYDQKIYELNLIDTPGHVDFTYEVSRSIAACEGALLIIDATQGIQAQTLANLYLALEQGLTIIPILNKIDLPNAQIEEVTAEVVDMLGCEVESILHVSAKEGTGIKNLLKNIITKIPSPKGNPSAPLQAIVFDAVFNAFRGIEVYFRIFNGSLKRGDKISLLRSSKSYQVDELGVLKLEQVAKDKLSVGDVGYLTASIKTSKEVKVGDTLTLTDNPCNEAIKGFSDVKPMIFAGIYPIENSKYNLLRSALEKLQLNDASLVWDHETSLALGLGFRCGFLGMLHMEIMQERLSREFDVEVFATAPSVQFRVTTKEGNKHFVQSAATMPHPSTLDYIEEPIMVAQIITQTDFVGAVIELCMERRGSLEAQDHLTSDRVKLEFRLPLAEIVLDFFDRLKSITKGYSSLDYTFDAFEKSAMVRLDILLNGEKIDALSLIIHRDKAYRWGRKLCLKLKEILPSHLFEIPIQAAIGSKIIAREAVKALRKDVIAKCYGGDITRKRKLLAKQKAGKKKMRQVGSVRIPQEAFLAILKIN